MNKLHWLLHIYERAREPSRAAEERLQRALRARVPDGQASRALLADLDPPTPEAEQRLFARVAALPEREPRRTALPIARWALAGASACALGLALLHLPLERAPAPLDQPLASRESQAGLAELPGVSLAYHDGYGELGGTTIDPEIRWIAGQIDVSVEPDRGIHLAVRTDEATVRVIGTRFNVLRRDGQTTVTVQHGKVEVSCVDGTQRFLSAGEAATCEPRSAARLALRAVRLRERGGEPAEVLSLAERGLESARPGSAAWAQLSLLRAEALRGLGRREEALAAVTAYLDSGATQRQGEALGLALDLSEQPCTLALARRAQLQGEQAGAASLVRLADCLPATEALPLLERAVRDPALDPADKERVERRIEAR